jgi:glycosyltransferase involved in cell wall biosynthesis
MALSYSIVTPVCNESDNLPALAAALDAQAKPPRAWLVVDTGSTDETVSLSERLAAERPWLETIVVAEKEMRRGAPIVRALHAGIARLTADPPDVLVKVDADVTFEGDYFARLLEEFQADEHLGIASGSAWELRAGEWTQLFGTRTSVWGAARAYRWACLQDVIPLESRMGWDGVDELKANVCGWETRTITTLPFKHHRLEGGRDGSRWAAWRAQGTVAWFMAYRPTYLVARTAYRSLHEPAALAILDGYVRSAVRRAPRLEDARARAYLRDRQRWRELVRRLHEARGRTPG